MKIKEAVIYRINMPFDRPYPLAFNQVDMAGLDSLVAQVINTDGQSGWGEVTILPGYTHETVDSGWKFCNEYGEMILGLDSKRAKRLLISQVEASPHAVNPLLCAIEMLESNPILHPDAEARVQVLAPVRSKDDALIPQEVEDILSKGHRTLKVKVGFDATADRRRIELIQKVVNGRARLRIDANQGYKKEDGCRFAASLDPSAVEWFEQPCDLKDWASNAAVAKASAVPVMLDESIYSFADIQRAAGLEGVGHIKHVLEKFGGLELLKAALDHVRICGMTPTVGNGAATDLSSWMEASVARLSVTVACEMHGFLKIKEPLLTEPLPFVDGAIVLGPRYKPGVKQDVVEKYATARSRLAPISVSVRSM